MTSPAPQADRPKLKLILIIVALFLVIVGATALLMPYFARLSDPAVQQQLRAWITDLGFRGWLVFFLLQMLQIIIAFIPGEAVQILAGVLYGTWGGLFTCLLGAVVASALIFYTVRKLGDRLVERLFGRKKLDEYSFLRDSERIETITFILFLLPGMPKDLLTYLAGISRIAPGKFLLISTIARVPALTVSTLMGASASQGNLLLTALIVLGAVLVALAGVIYRQRITAFLHRHSRHSSQSDEL